MRHSDDDGPFQERQVAGRVVAHPNGVAIYSKSNQLIGWVASGNVLSPQKIAAKISETLADNEDTE